METFISTNTCEAAHSGELAIAPVTTDYRTRAIAEGFAWHEILEATAPRWQERDSLYLVVFRSIRRPDVDDRLISELDARAHEEANQSTALLHYFAGELGSDRCALSWCLWTDMDAARQALTGEAHAIAVAHANAFYEDFGIELYTVHPGASIIDFEAVGHHTA